MKSLAYKAGAAFSSKEITGPANYNKFVERFREARKIQQTEVHLRSPIRVIFDQRAIELYRIPIELAKRMGCGVRGFFLNAHELQH
jgi:hypothetical protein